VLIQQAKESFRQAASLRPMVAKRETMPHVAGNRYSPWRAARKIPGSSAVGSGGNPERSQHRSLDIVRAGYAGLREAESAYREGHNTSPPELPELVDEKRIRLVLFSLPIPPISNTNVLTHPADKEV
jgi:hypothetical protein